MEPQQFRAPFLDQHEIWRQADDFRNRVWPHGTIPVDVMEIVEFELELDIRPISKLREDVDVDALLLGDFKTLVVDQEHYMNERYANRLRFSIAHELGHYVLHRAVFQHIPRNSGEEWIRFMRRYSGKRIQLSRVSCL